MDADIAAAKDHFELAKIRAQDARNHNRRIQERYRTFVEWAMAEYAKLEEDPQAMRKRLTLSIADKYMTTSTAKDPAVIQADAEQDAARLKAGVDAILKQFPAAG